MITNEVVNELILDFMGKQFGSLMYVFSTHSKFKVGLCVILWLSMLMMDDF